MVLFVYHLCVEAEVTSFLCAFFFVLSYSISMLIMFCNKSLHDLSL